MAAMAGEQCAVARIGRGTGHLQLEHRRGPIFRVVVVMRFKLCRCSRGIGHVLGLESMQSFTLSRRVYLCTLTSCQVANCAVKHTTCPNEREYALLCQCTDALPEQRGVTCAGASEMTRDHINALLPATMLHSAALNRAPGFSTSIANRSLQVRQRAGRCAQRPRLCPVPTGAVAQYCNMHVVRLSTCGADSAALASLIVQLTCQVAWVNLWLRHENSHWPCCQPHTPIESASCIFT